MASYAGAPALTGKRDVDKAKKLSAEAEGREDRGARPRGYAQPACPCIGLRRPLEKTRAQYRDRRQRLGLSRHPQGIKETVAEGGRNIVGTGWAGADMLDPTLNQARRTNAESVWFGWPSDD